MTASIAPATLRSPLTLVVEVPSTSALPSFFEVFDELGRTSSPSAASWQAVTSPLPAAFLLLGLFEAPT